MLDIFLCGAFSTKCVHHVKIGGPKRHLKNLVELVI